MTKYRLMPNESIIMQETCVAHGGVRASHTDELLLTTLNIVCIHKGVFGNTKNIFVYPLNQIKMFNGMPQIIVGKLFNGYQTLNIYFNSGESESFYFQAKNKQTIEKWIEAIMSTLGLDPSVSGAYSGKSEHDDQTLVGVIRNAGNEFLGVLGFKTQGSTVKSKASPSVVSDGESVSLKCVSCSAPLIGTKGKIIKCKYCDTEQTI